jgi:hypothetical protein
MSVEHRAWLLFGLLLLVGTAGGLTWYLVASTRYATFEISTADPVSGLITDSPVEFHTRLSGVSTCAGGWRAFR